MSRPLPSGFEHRLKTQALAAGFDLAGIATLGAPDTAAHFDAWLAAGQHGEMSYLERGAELRRDARRPVAGMVSALVVALNYGGTQPAGPVARYARFADYHRVMWDTLDALLVWVRDELPDVQGRSFVDSGPVLERDLAQRAGLGWFGKNTLLINPQLGSFFFLGALFLDVALTPDEPFVTDHCGTCTRCLEACPTQAFVAPHVLDARRCISYLTIELRGAHTTEQAAMIGDHLFGCDVCQEVCPWNQKFSAVATAAAFTPMDRLATPDARALARTFLATSPGEFAEEFKHTPLSRAKLVGLKRNAASVLANVGTIEDSPALMAALAVESDPTVLEALRTALAACDG
ncbi:MAG: tRNA epoxyqueuosine(34) reductase QueG [Gemmatimonadaceae bacterium]|nr:tRNA epoxyqueuosine(34) reductase QueG [Gemmatimonadaceae bacterium]